MKVGIITFHRALNYGALLQAFALQHTLSKLGTDAQIVDYRNSIIENMYSYPTFFQRKTLKSKIKYLLQGRYEMQRRQKFEAYRVEYLNLSTDIYSCDNISLASDKFDKFITGSDQVWNYSAHDFDENYFLRFVNESEKKYSYAASFGISSLPNDYSDKYRDLLGDFSMCSVREIQGLNILEQLDIDRRRVDIDPTMLLTKEEWKSQFKIDKLDKRKYIFAYYFELTRTLREYVEQLARQTGYTVLYVGNPLKSPFQCKCRALKTADPVDFIKTIANAEYVVTNSFHGTALSMIFNKKFYVELLKTDAKVNSRIENVLQTFSLESRLINSSKGSDDVDWKYVNSKMDELRIKSLEYLRGIIT